MDNIYCFIGRSGSGKSTLVDKLSNRFGYQVVQSYTTRQPRHKYETGHIFISKKEFNELEDVVAYNNYNGNEYCVTQQQIDENDLYIVDIPGLKYLRDTYKGAKKIVTIGLYVSEWIARDRMQERNDNPLEIEKRLALDNEEFAELNDYCDIVLNTESYDKNDLVDLVSFIMFSKRV